MGADGPAAMVHRGPVLVVVVDVDGAVLAGDDDDAGGELVGDGAADFDDVHADSAPRAHHSAISRRRTGRS